ncbi:hypothetical protein AcV5_005034 [Taiwanofungus camphoratus]|nr:hypothetical protein AcW2_000369 [Antrodia cinnamomea]KAI0937040.1 hypothetical protein AcV5_005034 [Antrodia cinnamomea]
MLDSSFEFTNLTMGNHTHDMSNSASYSNSFAPTFESRTCPDDPAVGTVCNVRVKLTSSSVSWIRARLMTLTYIHIHVESSGRERCKDSTGLFARRNCALEPGAKTQVSPFHGDLKVRTRISNTKLAWDCP